jgi:hypothetical protein
MELISTAVSTLSLVLASAAFISNRKNFLLTIANQRSVIVNELFNIKSKGGLVVADKSSDIYVWFWTDIISEIIISNNIIAMTAGKYKVVKKIYGINDVQKIFWEQLNTSIRKHFMNYIESDIEINGSETQNTLVRKEQIRTIINNYLQGEF